MGIHGQVPAHTDAVAALGYRRGRGRAGSQERSALNLAGKPRPVRHPGGAPPTGCAGGWSLLVPALGGPIRSSGLAVPVGGLQRLPSAPL